MLRSFEQEIGHNVTRPNIAVDGAYGAALYAKSLGFPNPLFFLRKS